MEKGVIVHISLPFILRHIIQNRIRHGLFDFKACKIFPGNDMAKTAFDSAEVSKIIFSNK